MNEHGRLPRLSPERYRGFAAVHWSLTLHRRATGWVTPLFHARFREILVHTCIRHDLVCPMYCLMPDHIHLLLRGISYQADQRKAVAFLRRHVNAALAPHRFQREAYDNVLRREDLEREAFRAVAYYIAENPARAKLAAAARDYLFTGAVIPGFPDLAAHREDYWAIFWTLQEGLLRKNGYEG